MDDHYETIASRCEWRQKIERSDFLGIAFPMTTDEAFFDTLTAVSKQHFDATHHCWAFRLRERARSSDAGEPSGTAGKPILQAIEATELYETGVIVVRWFGGVKLGTGGLSRAYRETAAQTLAAATRLERFLYSRFEVIVPFDALGTIYRLVSPPDVVLAGEEFGEENVFRIDVRRSKAGAFAAMLTEKRLAFRRGN